MFVADGLSALINQGIVLGNISPLRITRRAPSISHLLFADDTLLFFKASDQQATHVKNILDAYGHAT